MNQNVQMREALQQVRRDIESLTALQNGTVNHVVKGACGTLDRVMQALNHTPDTGKMADHVGDANKMVRPSDEKIWALWHELPNPHGNYAIARFAEEIMDEMERLNK